MFFCRQWLLHIIAVSIVSALHSQAVRASDVTVAAAISLKDALEEIKPELEKALPGTKLLITTGASGTLSQQITQGAPIDLFLSAATKPMERVAQGGAIVAESRRIFLTNEMVLIVPKKNPGSVRTFADLKSPRVKHVAIGEPRSVPAGEYAAQVLKVLDLESALKAKLVLAKDVRQVLAYVGRGEAEAGFVYASDLLAKNAGGVKAVAVAPFDSHETIVYEIAQINRSGDKRSAEIKSVQDFIGGEYSRKIWLKYGFQFPAKKTADQSKEKPASAPL